MKQNNEIEKEKLRVGLCFDCTYAKVIDTDHGSRFYLCQLSATDPKFPKYPRLPVVQCSGYVPKM